MKCSKEHKTSQFEVCWLNSSHHIPQQEIASDLRTCPDRKAVEIKFIKGWPVHGKEASLERGQLPESHEDWESEAGLHLPYNPHQMAMKKQVIRQPPRGATRLERKMFIAAEKKRHADLGLEEEKKCLGQELPGGGRGHQTPLPVAISWADESPVGGLMGTILLGRLMGESK